MCQSIIRTVTALVVALSASAPSAAYTLTYLDAGYNAAPFATLPIGTNALTMDLAMNLFTGNISSGLARVVKWSAASGYTDSSGYSSFNTTTEGITGLDFGGETLYTSLSYSPGNSGLIANADTGALVVDLPSFRPTGIDARDGIVFSGRQANDRDFGNLYRLNSDGSLTILIPGIPFRGVAIDAANDIYVSTRDTAFDSFIEKSIYRFSAASSYNTDAALRIASFDTGVAELFFDSAGKLYAYDTDNPIATTIFQISTVPVPAALPLFLAGLGVLLTASSRRDSL